MILSYQKLKRKENRKAASTIIFGHRLPGGNGKWLLFALLCFLLFCSHNFSPPWVNILRRNLIDSQWF